MKIHLDQQGMVATKSSKSATLKKLLSGLFASEVRQPDSWSKFEPITQKLKLQTNNLKSISRRLGLSPTIKQHLRRHQKILKHRMGQQRSWLLCAVPPKQDSSLNHKSDWLKDTLKKIAIALPNNAYKIIALHLAHRLGKDSTLYSDDGTIRFGVREGLYLVIYPTIGLFCFQTPSKNMKKRLEMADFPCEWNWSIGISPFEDAARIGHTDCANSAISLENEIKAFNAKHGMGQGSTICVIDSGICPESKELNEKILAQFKIIAHPKGHFYWEHNVLEQPVTDHGTKVASIAAGRNLGIAKEAKVISYVLPIRNDRKFESLAFYYTLYLILSDYGPCIGHQRVRDIVSTILLANGIFLRNEEQKNYAQAMSDVFRKFNDEHDVVVVASTGNTSGQVAFPAEFQLVFAVGALDQSGGRLQTSGYGIDSTGATLPNCHVYGEAIPCEGTGAARCHSTGTSFSAGLVAGLFAVLASTWPSAGTRWQKITNAINGQQDQYGELKVLDLSKI